MTDVALPDFKSLSGEIAKRREKLEEAKQLREDEVNAERSLLTRLVDRFSETPAEKLVKESGAQYREKRHEAIELLYPEVDRLARIRAQQDPRAKAELEALAPEMAEAVKQKDAAQELELQGKYALKTIDKASESCTYALGFELGRARGNNPISSWAANSASSKAQDRVSTAMEETKAFVDGLKAKDLSGKDVNADVSLNKKHDKFLCFEVSFSAMHNAFESLDVIGELKDLSKQLTPLLREAHDFSLSAQEAHREVVSKEDKILDPFRAEVVASFPANIIQLNDRLSKLSGQSAQPPAKKLTA